MIRIGTALAASALALLAGHAAAAPRGHAEVYIETPPAAERDAGACEARVPPGARWFYLGTPGDGAYAGAARRAMRAIVAAYDGKLLRDPRCLHIEILDDDALEQRYKRLGRRGPNASIVGFHNPKLGADSTVFVVPQPGQGLDVVIVHEVLHALSHRFSSEAGRHRLNHLVEGATEYLTRELAATALGVGKRQFRTGYGDYVAFYDALMKRLGAGGRSLLESSYFTDGYDAFEGEVDRRLGKPLRPAGRALESDDLREAVQRLSARAGGEDGTEPR